MDSFFREDPIPFCDHCRPKAGYDLPPVGLQPRDYYCGELSFFQRPCKRCQLVFDGVMYFASMFREEADPTRIYVECDSRQTSQTMFEAELSYTAQNAFPAEISFEFTDMPDMSAICIQVSSTTDHIILQGNSAAQTEVSLQITQSWISRCSKEHGQRCMSSSRVSLPSRMLDLSKGMIRLVQGTDVQKHHEASVVPHYIALSHCWGRNPIVTTTMSNIMAMRENIPVESLPRTFQDAILITRRLGLEYLWIDSLCIIQDSKEDWEKESASMGSVYQHAFLTIAATRSLDGTGGCLTTAHEALYVWPQRPNISDTQAIRKTSLVRHERLWGPVWLGDQQQGRWMSLRPTYDVGRLSREGTSKSMIDEGFPLLTRAWFLQERLLSPRVLHFGHMELFWECRCQFWTEYLVSEPESLRTLVKQHKHNPNFLKRLTSHPKRPLAITKASTSAQEQFSTAKTRKMYDALTSSPVMHRQQDATTDTSNAWHTLIEEYSKLDLTQEMDRLPALSGIASFRGGDGYLAGIWTDQLPGSLCWTTSPSQHSPIRRPHSYRAPSFSWASVEGPIKYCRALSAKRQEWDIITPEQTSYTAATVVGSASTVEGLDPCGRVTAGHVEIEGWVGTAAVVQVTQEKYRSVCTLQQGDRLQKFYLDIPLRLCRDEPAEVRSGDDVLLLLLECEKIPPSTFYKHGYRVMTLVLKPSAEFPGAYERAGLVFPADDLTVYFSNFQSGGADIGDGSSMFDDAPGWFNEKKTVRIV